MKSNSSMSLTVAQMFIKRVDAKKEESHTISLEKNK